MLGLQTDFAMLFLDEPATTASSTRQYMFWLGNVQRLIMDPGHGRRRVEYREPVDLDSLPADGTVLVVAQWYRRVEDCITAAGIDGVYELKVADHRAYDIKHVLTPLTLRSRKSVDAGGVVSFVCELSTLDRAAINTAIDTIHQAEHGTGTQSSSSNARQSSHRKRRQANQHMPADGRSTHTSTATSGRQRRVVTFSS
jgi:hypothetical protein